MASVPRFDPVIPHPSFDNNVKTRIRNNDQLFVSKSPLDSSKKFRIGFHFCRRLPRLHNGADVRIVAERRAHAKRREVIDGELIRFAGRENGRLGELPNDRRDCGFLIVLKDATSDIDGLQNFDLTFTHIALALHPQVLAIAACQKNVVVAIQRHQGSGRPLDKGLQRHDLSHSTTVPRFL